MQASPKTDWVMKWLLWGCGIVAVACGGAAYYYEWFPGGVIAFSMVGVAAFPIFHFAMHWPFRQQKKNEKDAHRTP